MYWVALLLGVAACRTSTQQGMETNPPLCNPGGQEFSLRRIDTRCRLVNEFGYSMGGVEAQPMWHNYDTGVSTPQEPMHPVLCPANECAEVELTFPDWSSPDIPVILLALNPSNIWAHAFFPVQCRTTEEGLTCRARMHQGATTIVNVHRYTIQPRAGGRAVDVRGTITGRYRGQAFCVSRIGIDLYAIQVPLVSTEGTILGHSHAYCETYSQ